MKRLELEHLIRACGSIAEDNELIIFGSQAVLGQFPGAPPQLLTSVAADIMPRNFPERSDLIDGSIGELSPFHKTFGYYAHGVSIEAATLPEGWENRLVPIQNSNTRGVLGLCLDVHDLALSKYAAGREKDLRFTAVLAQAGFVQQATLLERAEKMPLDKEQGLLVRSRIARDFS